MDDRMLALDWTLRLAGGLALAALPFLLWRRIRYAWGRFWYQILYLCLFVSPSKAIRHPVQSLRWLLEWALDTATMPWLDHGFGYTVQSDHWTLKLDPDGPLSVRYCRTRPRVRRRSAPETVS